MRIYLTILLFFATSIIYSQSIFINEIQSSNSKTIYDFENESSDWIEIYNANNYSVSLKNYYLSDNNANLNKWKFPDINILPDSFIIVFASGKDTLVNNEYHTNFKLSSSGEDIILSDSNLLLIDKINAITIEKDYSYGRISDGDNVKVFFEHPTPNYSNSLCNNIAVSDSVLFSHKAGFYKNDFFLTLSKSISQGKIYYTTDGSIPTKNSQEYTEPIKIYDKTNEPNKFSSILTSLKYWKEPKDNVFKISVIRAVVYYNNYQLSDIYTSSYFVNKNMQERYNVPIFSITTDSVNFFSIDSGIYVPGNVTVEHEYYSNYNKHGKEWERLINVEYFEKDGKRVINQNMGGRMHGNARRYKPQKTIRLYARKEYGNKYINYKFFDNKEIYQFKRLLLRSPLSNGSNSMFKDELCHDLVKDIDIDMQSAKLCIVFVNGEYWGIHSIRERQDRFYVEENHNIESDNLDILSKNKEILEGDEIEYTELINYIENNSLKDKDNYEYIKTKIDIESFINYQIIQLYYANTDWPASNITYWKQRTNSAKWRWFFYDCDWCMSEYTSNLLIEYDRGDIYNQLPDWTRVIFASLLKNDEFRNQFLQKIYYHMNYTFEPKKVIEKIEEYELMYEPLMVEHINRWSYPSTFKFWHEKVVELKTFAVNRPKEIFSQLIDIYDIPFTIFPNPNNGTFNIKIDYIKGIDVSVDIYDNLGRLIRTQKINNTTNFESRIITISDLNKGVYIIRLKYGNLLFNNKVVVI